MTDLTRTEFVRFSSKHLKQSYRPVSANKSHRYDALCEQNKNKARGNGVLDSVTGVILFFFSYNFIIILK